MKGNRLKGLNHTSYPNPESTGHTATAPRTSNWVAALLLALRWSHDMEMETMASSLG